MSGLKNSEKNNDFERLSYSTSRKRPCPHGPLPNYLNSTYYYVYNVQGDVTGIVSSTGSFVVNYTYDTWGKLLSTTGSKATTLGVQNPFRYRGYYYDTETGLYYLQSRYYDPETGRFLSADDFTLLLEAADNPLQANLYTYCGNNPVTGYDPTGYFSIPRWTISVPLDFLTAPLSPYLAPIKSFAKNFAGNALKMRISTPLVNMIKSVARIASNVLNTIRSVVSKIPFVGKGWANQINVAGISRSIANAATSATFNFILNTIIPNITVFLSVGGFVAGLLDVLSDRRLDNRITIPFAW
jgi:RHS repeat-associated protein